MKKIIKPAEQEEVVFYSDFSGKNLGNYSPPIELSIDFGYGSNRDGASLRLHLTDEDVQPILDLIKSRLSVDFKENAKKELIKQEKSFEDSMQFRDWGSCDFLSNSMWFMREMLDLKIEE